MDRDDVLAATEEVLRRHGPDKAGVVDVARVLGVSHTAVYRHFPSKAALREAVTRRWLGRADGALERIATGPGSRDDRLRGWLTALFAAKRAAVTDEPELFATYRRLAAEHSAAAADHVADLLAQLARILADQPDPRAAALAVFDATTPFHHPAHVGEWSRPDADARFAAVCDLVLAGLS